MNTHFVYINGKYVPVELWYKYEDSDSVTFSTSLSELMYLQLINKGKLSSAWIAWR